MRHHTETNPFLFSVSDHCISCDTCSKVAPDHFCLDNPNNPAIVFSQPKNKAQSNVCIQALESCPVGAIEEKNQ